MSDGFVIGFACVSVAIYAWVERPAFRPNTLRTWCTWLATVLIVGYVAGATLIVVGMGGAPDRAHF